MKTRRNQSVIRKLVAVSFLAVNAALAQQAGSMLPLAPDAVPRFGTFLSLDRGLPPTPFNPFAGTDLYVPIYALGNGQFGIADAGVDYSLIASHKLPQDELLSLDGQSLMLATIGPPPPPDDGGTNAPPPPRPDKYDLVRNYAKFASNNFTVIISNTVVYVDTNLYDALLRFPPDNSTNASLQIMQYGTNAVIIKANHFDYSMETERDFALLIVDKVNRPIWKSVDLSGASDAQDGWLIQGLVPRWKVTDPMFMMVSNLNSSWNGFFNAIPYGGPQIQVSGVQPFDTVSNLITLHAAISDLSGTTNTQIRLNVDGFPARYSIGPNNSVTLDTIYNRNGIANLYLTAGNTDALVYNPLNAPLDTKLNYASTFDLPLDFENASYLLSASDMCSPRVGTNYILFAVDKAQQIAATISHPSGAVVASYSGYVPGAMTVAIGWNFTEADKITPYTEDSYVVTFTAFDPATFTMTNQIARAGVRAGASCFISYQQEDPADPSGDGPYLNSEAVTWIDGTLRSLYDNLYRWDSLTQYTPSVVGANRNWDLLIARTPWSANWKGNLGSGILDNLQSTNYSEFTLTQVHGSGAEIGGGPDSYLPGTFTPGDLQTRVMSTNRNWRLRKAALWSCYSGNIPLATAGFYKVAWPDACGIPSSLIQEGTFIGKNCGLFFAKEFPQRGYNGQPSVTTARITELLDQVWVCGQWMIPGACSPTYSFNFAVMATRQMYPDLDIGEPTIFGYHNMIYSSLDIYDDAAMNDDNSFVTQ